MRHNLLEIHNPQTQGKSVVTGTAEMCPAKDLGWRLIFPLSVVVGLPDQDGLSSQLVPVLYFTR